ncbi:hypothetical protein I6F33_32705 [Bradyrhizobium sp. BRP20]|uniref:hypothetical protein n=1 Tax=Bradyrhizobium sp. BRP20 TaxID=2793822 RepID=UPI001CD48FD9|nr:hypothetical protein [Bradyrhizobium sp. BRP20]MCA1437690.1 hypothetical protein [Bradyrhizobium sp. BRP20]
MEDDVNSSPLARTITAGYPEHQSSFAMDDLVRANLWLGRIRQARQDMLTAFMECPSTKLAKRLAGLERYEKPIRAAQRRALKRWLQEM